MPPPMPDAPLSVLEEVAALAVGHTRFELSFEDITGFSYDAPELALEETRRYHCSAFCRYAKAHQGRYRECTINKRLCNRKASKGKGFIGLCHLGLLEAVEPLVLEGKVMGVFYFGNVVIRGREKASRQKITTFCRRHHVDAEPYLCLLRGVPRVSEAEWEAGVVQFRRAVRLAAAFVQTIGLPVESYTVHEIRNIAVRAHQLHPLSRSAVGWVRQHYREPCTLAAAAAALGCHPVHLGRTFRRDLGLTFTEFLHRVRISHAKRLLRVTAMNAARVSYETGFADPGHFSRTFQRLTGQTPGEFARAV